MRYVCRIVDLPNNRLHNGVTISSNADFPFKVCVIIIDTEKNTRADYHLPEDMKNFIANEKKTYGVLHSKARKTTHICVIPPEDVKILDSLKLIKRTNNPATKTRFKAISGSPRPYVYNLDNIYSTPAPFSEFTSSFENVNTFSTIGAIIRFKFAPMWLSEDGTTLRIEMTVETCEPRKRLRNSEVMYFYYKIKGNEFFSAMALGQVQ